MVKKLRLPALLTAATFAVGFTTGALPGLAQTSDPLPEVEPSVEEPSGESGTEESSPVATDTRFECQLSNSEYTVMYLPENQPERAYAWATPGEMGGGWTAERRCFTISERLESYRPEGLAELQVGTENGYETVCATTEQFPSLCKIVFTIPPGQNAVLTRDLVFENLTLADSGTDTTVVSTFAPGENNELLNNNDLLGELSNVLGDFSRPSAQSANDAINLKPFLAPSDGGTGEALGDNVNSGRTLNPDRFR